tara:strand:- start:2832 stop:4202 length:1371 start_codon:yes stop_codon:yes gene_type:complete
MKISRNVFREYDVRGIADIDFSGKFATCLGKAFGSYVIRKKQKKIAVSGDVRLSTPRLKKDFISGLIQSGVDVIDIGVLPTPVNYFANYNLSIDGSVQITGSHNPMNYNGFKFTFQKKSFFGEDIQKLYELIINNDYEIGEGGYTKYNIIDEYVDDIVGKVNINKKIKVIMDCGNAAGCIVGPQIFKKLNIDLEEMYCDIDGNFPNHHPDPTVDSNLDSIVLKIKEGEFDLGVAYDGDADRVVCIDSNGQIIRSDILMCIFAQDILKKTSNKKIVYDVKCSSAIKEVISNSGGEPIEWKTGHSLIKNKMKVEGADLAGEMSGHIFFADRYYGYDDAIYVSLRLIEILSNNNLNLSDMVSTIPRYYSTPELRFECTNDEVKFDIMTDLERYFEKKYPCSTIDGIKIFVDNGWGLLRASNTQPVIVCRIEGKTNEELDNIKSIISLKLSEYEDVDFEF